MKEGDGGGRSPEPERQTPGLKTETVNVLESEIRGTKRRGREREEGGGIYGGETDKYYRQDGEKGERWRSSGASRVN